MVQPCHAQVVCLEEGEAMGGAAVGGLRSDGTLANHELVQTPDH